MSDLNLSRNKLDKFTKVFEMITETTKNQYIYMIDMVSNYSRWSMNAIEYFDLPGEYFRKPIEVWADKVYKDDKQRFIDNMNKLYSGETYITDCEYRVENYKGEIIWIRFSGKITYNSENKPEIILGMVENLGFRFKYDPLTKLLSRYIANEHIYNCIDENRKCTVMLLDIDNFKRINLLRGYKFGDEVLCYVARVMDTTYPGCCYRRSEDSFMFLSHGEYDTKKVFDTINDKLHNAVINGVKMNITLSAGVTEFPTLAGSFGELIATAEDTLNIAKSKQYKRSYAEYCDKDKENRLYLINVRETLDKSIDNNCEGFYLVYQPLIDNKTGKLYGAEALLRFKHDTMKIYPDTFIPILEDSGEIHEIGEFILRTAFNQAKEWIKIIPDFKISVNVSYVQMRDSEFCNKVNNIIEEVDIDPNSVILELTESCKVVDPDKVESDFVKCQELGITTALDDFGTGYSSIAMLRKLHPNIIKIDHTFVASIDNSKLDQSILEYIIELANVANISVVVEGIENQTILDTVSKFNPDILQGYFFDKPLDSNEFTEKYILCNQKSN